MIIYSHFHPDVGKPFIARSDELIRDFHLENNRAERNSRTSQQQEKQTDSHGETRRTGPPTSQSHASYAPYYRGYTQSSSANKKKYDSSEGPSAPTVAPQAPQKTKDMPIHTRLEQLEDKEYLDTSNPGKAPLSSVFSTDREEDVANPMTGETGKPENQHPQSATPSDNTVPATPKSGRTKPSPKPVRDRAHEHLQASEDKATKRPKKVEEEKEKELEEETQPHRSTDSQPGSPQGRPSATAGAGTWKKKETEVRKQRIHNAVEEMTAVRKWESIQGKAVYRSHVQSEAQLRPVEPYQDPDASKGKGKGKTQPNKRAPPVLR